MTKKKHRKGDGTSSSDDSDSSSSSSSSDSSNSSEDRKKQPKKSQSSSKCKKEETTEIAKKNVKRSRSLSRDEARAKVEQSKWDSPDQKSKRDSRRPEKLQRHTEHLPSSYRDHSVKHSEAVEHDRSHNRPDNPRSSNHSKTQHSRDDRRDRRHADGDEERYHHSRQTNVSSFERKQRGNRETYRTDYRNRRDDNKSDERHRKDNRDNHRSNDRYHSREDVEDNRRGERHERYRNDYRNDRFNRNKRRRSRSGSFNHKEAKWGKEEGTKQSKNEQSTKEKDKPNFGLSGKLTEETNTFRGIVIKYSEPPEARKPKRRWRLYPFKGDKALQTLYIHRESAYLIGRERKVVDLPVDHPSCSKQHAVLQYRLVPFTRDDGSTGKKVRPYLIDLESANGTLINNKKIEAKRYVELLEKDVIKFGFSSREYVLLHENSKDEADDDDVKDEEVIEVVKKEKEG